jgi:uncharacterized membrane protein
MTLVVPLGSGPDEPEHTYRAFQLALGDLFPSIISCTGHAMRIACRGDTGPLSPATRAGGPVPPVLVATFDQLYALFHHHLVATPFKASDYSKLLGWTLGGSARRFANFENTALYSPVNYLPEIVVFWIAQHTSESVLAALFTARLATGLVWVALVTAAVALTPRWKWLFSLVVLVPTALSQSAVINADAASLGVVALTAAYALRLADRGRPPRPYQLALLALLGLVLGLMKLPLIVVLAAALAIVWPVLGHRRAWLAGAIALPGLAASLWWNLASSTYFVPYRNIVYGVSTRALISQQAQEHYLLAHPYELPVILWNTAVPGHLLMLWEVVGTLGEAGLPEWFAIVWLVLFVVLAIGSEDHGVTRAARWWIAGALAVYFIGTALALYVTWTQVGASSISGMHGRYFTLVLVFAIPLLAGLGSRWIGHRQRAIAAASVIISGLAAVTMFVYASYHYYGQGPWQVVPKLTSVLF